MSQRMDGNTKLYEDQIVKKLLVFNLPERWMKPFKGELGFLEVIEESTIPTGVEGE